MKRYFVTHANVRNATKLAPIAIQTQAIGFLPRHANVAPETKTL